MSRKKAEAAQIQETAQSAPEMAALALEPRVLTLAPAAQPILAITPQAPPSPEEVLKMADNQIQIRRGYVKLVAASLRPEDVLVFGEEVYLPAKPCQDILSWARIRVKPHWPVEEHHYNSPQGEFIEFVITATLTDTGGREVDAMGNRSTRDEFFGISGKETVCPECKTPVKWQRLNPNDRYDSSVCPTHGRVKAEKVVHYLMLYDVDIPSVRSAAVTNLWNKSLKAIGLMPTLQDLADAGMDINRVKRVDFSGEKKKPAAPQQAPPKQSTTPQSTQPTQAASKPATAPPSAAPSPSGPPKANLPPTPGVERVIAGRLDEIKPGTTIPKDKTTGQPTGVAGRPFLGLVVSGARLTCFDNKKLLLDTRGNTKDAFELLLGALGMRVELRVKKSGNYENVVGYQRIADNEWEADGTPVLRREPAQDTMGDAFEASDEDVTF